jgi:hypothetical protein
MKDEILDEGLFPNWDGYERKDFIEIRTYPFDHEAQIAKAFLEAEGIPSFLKNGNMLSVYSGLSAGFGGVGLIVLKKDAERALEVLDNQEEEIEVNDEMLMEAYLHDMELEAAEKEQFEDEHQNKSRDHVNNFIIGILLFILLFMLFLLL